MTKKMNRRELFKTSAAAGAVIIAGDLFMGRSPVANGEVNMTIDDVFNAAKTGFTYLYAYVTRAGQEIGRERTVGLMTKVFENMGAIRGKMVKEQVGNKEFDAKAACSLIRTSKDTIGLSYKVVEESAQRVVIRNDRCPMYEAARALGMDAKTIEGLCRGGPLSGMNASVKQLNPNLNILLQKFRSTPDDFCEEVIILT